MIRTRRIKGEQISSLVHSYLKKRQFTQDGGEIAHKKDRKHTQGVDEMALSKAVNVESSVANYFCYSSVSGDASVCDQQYSKLRLFISDAIEPYREELQCLLYPLFVHVYLELLCNGHKPAAHRFYSRHQSALGEREPGQTIVLTELQQMFNREDVFVSRPVTEFRENRYKICLSEGAFHYVFRYLKNEECILLLQIFNKHFDFKAVGRPENVSDPQQGDEKTSEQMALASPPCTPENKVIHSEQTLSSLQQCIQKVRSGMPCVPSVCLYTVGNIPQSVCAADLTADQTKLVVGGEDATLHLWSTTPQPLHSQAAAINVSYIHLSGDHPADRQQKQSIGTEKEREMIKMRGHSGAIYSAKFSSDDQFIVSASADNTARLWDLQTHCCQAVYRGHNYPIWTVDASPIGSYFVTGSHDRTAKLWTTERVHPLRTFLGHTADVDVARFHPNCNYIATGSSDRVVRLWSLQDGQSVRLFQGHKATIYALAFSSNGKLLATAGEDRHVKIWDLSSGALFKNLRGHTDIIYSLSFNPDSSILCSGGLDGSLKVWNVESNDATSTSATASQETVSPELLASFPVRSTTIHHLQFTKRGVLMTVGAPNN